MVGIYNRAFMLVHLPVHNLTASISRVLLPAFSTLQHERPRLKQAYLTALSLTSYIILPTCIGIAATAGPLVRVMLGDQWLEAIPVLQIVALIVGINMLSTFGGILCESLADLNFKLALQGGYVVVQAILMIYASRFGLLGLAWAMFLGEVLRHIAYLIAGRRLVHYSFLDVVTTYLPAILTSIIIGVASYGLSVAFAGSGVPMIIQLGAHMLLGGILLIGLLIANFNRPVRTQLNERLFSKIGFIQRFRALNWILR